MEVIVIDEFKKLVFFEGKMIFLRTDVISDFLKTQDYSIEDIRKATIEPKSINWVSFIFGNLFFGLLCTSGSDLTYKYYDRLKIIFNDNSYKYIDTGKLKLSKITEIKNQINVYLKSHQANS